MLYLHRLCQQKKSKLIRCVESHSPIYKNTIRVAPLLDPQRSHNFLDCLISAFIRSRSRLNWNIFLDMPITSVQLKLMRKFHHQYLFGTLSFMNILLFSLPLLSYWIPRDAALRSANLLSISKVFQSVVIMSLSLTLPNLLSSIFRILCLLSTEIVTVTQKQTRKTASGFFSLILCIPEVIILAYVIPYSDHRVFHFIVRTRLTLLIWKTFSVIYPQNQNSWPLASWLAIIIFYNTASITLLCHEYVNGTSHNDLAIISAVFHMLSFIIYAAITINWHFKFRMQMKHVRMTADQLTTSFYSIGLFLCWLCLIVINLTSPNHIEWYDWNSYSIASCAVMYPMFNLIVIMGEFLITDKEMLSALVWELK